MSRLSIRARLTLVLVFVAAVGVAAQAYGFAANTRDITALRDRSAALLELQQEGHQFEAALHAQHDAVNAYLLTHDSGEIDAYQAAMVSEAEAAGASGDLSSQFLGATEDLAAMRAAASTWRREFVTRAIVLVQTGTTAATFPPSLQNLGGVLYEQVRQSQDRYDSDLTNMYSDTVEALARTLQTQTFVFGVSIIGLCLGIVLATFLVSRWIIRPLASLLRTAKRVRDGQVDSFESRGDDEIGRLGGELERMRSAMHGQAIDAGIVNRFTELTAFVDSDGDVARATLDALEELTHPSDGTIHISNRSRDRALSEGSIGSVQTAVIQLGQLSQCPGVKRSSRYVTPDLAAHLAVRCPLYPASTGTLACIPLVALGDVIGVVHLHWDEAGERAVELSAAATSRITDHASLAIANRRLVVALQGQASTDGRTGLPNSRAFDEALERTLNSRSTFDPLAVLMLDIDHFKDFNDRNGHPGGDTALRVFADILSAAIRDGDLAARYGGEEFVVMLPGASVGDAVLVGERIRARAEEAVIALSPVHRDRITVSCGIAVFPDDAGSRVDLLEAADAALYRAKRDGRNQCVVAGEGLETRAGSVAAAEAEIAAAIDAAHGHPESAEAEPDPVEPQALPAPVQLPRAG